MAVPNSALGRGFLPRDKYPEGIPKHWFPVASPEAIEQRNRQIAAETLLMLGNPPTRRSNRPAAPKKFTNFVTNGSKRKTRRSRRSRRASTSRRR